MVTYWQQTVIAANSELFKNLRSGFKYSKENTNPKVSHM